MLRVFTHRIQTTRAYRRGIGAIAAGMVFFVMAPFVLAQPAPEEKAEELKNEIKDRASKIEELEKEIQQYQGQLNRVGAERKTLESAVTTLDVSRRKIAANINLTTEKIGATQEAIHEIEASISEKEKRIALNTGAIGKTLRTLYEADDTSTLEILVSGEDFADIWETIDGAVLLQVALREDVRKLQGLRAELTQSKSEAEGTKNELSSLHKELSGEKKALDVTRSEKATLLTQTKSQESEYQKLLNAKVAAREQFEKELAQLEAELKFTFDLGSIPAAGAGVLSWPFDASYMANCVSYTKALGNPTCITQYFGNTPFAKLGAYNGKGHNGIDFRAPTGTRILVAASGRVTAVGNTDAVRGCYSYGKWALVDHGNGISTLYAHLSANNVSQGEFIARGDLIGISGSTGYSTGPHLHFTVYATKGVEVRTLGGSTPCSKATIPVAATEAYLNPLSYL